MADHQTNSPLTRKQKDANLAKLRREQPAAVAASDAARGITASPSTAALLAGRGEAIDAAVSGRLKANQSTDAAN